MPELGVGEVDWNKLWVENAAGDGRAQSIAPLLVGAVDVDADWGCGLGRGCWRWGGRKVLRPYWLGQWMLMWIGVVDWNWGMLAMGRAQSIAPLLVRAVDVDADWSCGWVDGWMGGFFLKIFVAVLGDFAVFFVPLRN